MAEHMSQGGRKCPKVVHPTHPPSSPAPLLLRLLLTCDYNIELLEGEKLFFFLPVGFACVTSSVSPVMVPPSGGPLLRYRSTVPPGCAPRDPFHLGRVENEGTVKYDQGISNWNGEGSPRLSRYNIGREGIWTAEGVNKGRSDFGNVRM